MPGIGSRIIGWAGALPRPAKRLIALLLDALLCVASVWMAFYLRLSEWVGLSEILFPSLVSIAVALPLFIRLGLYRAIFRYAGMTGLVTVMLAVSIYSVLFAAYFTFVGVDGVPRTVGLIQPILLGVFVGLSRLIAKLIFDVGFRSLWGGGDGLRVLVYGAGSTGRRLAAGMTLSREMRLVGFVDDNPNLQGATINGVSIYGPNDIDKVRGKYAVTDVLLAIPSAKRERRNEIVASLRDKGLHVRTLPRFMDLTRDDVSVSDLKDLDIDDLLGRAPVPADVALMERNIVGKIVAVTGAGGSIGSELCRQIFDLEPAMLLLIERSEFALYTIHQELQARSRNVPNAPIVTPLLASVCNRRRIGEIFTAWRPHTVLHAAAYKHVPLVEHNAVEGIRNNVFGTLITAQAAKETGVENFILISTDKAVRPTNIMGTSKRLAEIVLQAMYAQSGKTRFSMVRFGNVLGSSGSVVPLFRRQIAAGGPITITHPDITRYFMTIPEAAQLVLQAGGMSKGGEVFVLDMGEPVRIFDLARNMIALSGLTVKDEKNPYGDIAIEIVGLRPGEKLYEELLIGDNPLSSDHPRIKLAREPFIPWPQLERHLGDLTEAIDEGDAIRARTLLRASVPEFGPTSEVVDFVSRQREQPSRTARASK